MMCDLCDHLQAKKLQALYEDEKVIAFSPEKPMIQGHVIVAPKEHQDTMQAVDDSLITHYFYVASYVASVLFDGLKCQGTNIIVNSGKHSSRSFPHFCIHVLPRWENDGLDFSWEKLDLAPNEMDSILSSVKDKAFMIGKAKKAPQGPVHLDKPIPCLRMPSSSTPPDHDERVSHLFRRP
ncbi:TPA: HIT family protein [Candidatus Woesearchaeota archaeon]|nr:HIT family protein [Candidatus Woesearchaeota archaeon]